MKPTTFVIIAATLLSSGCDKPDEKPAPSLTAPTPEKRVRPVSSPATNPVSETLPAAGVALPDEAVAYLADLAALAKQLDDLSVETAGEPSASDIESLQNANKALTVRRTELMTRLTPEQKQELAQKTTPAMRRVVPTLLKHRLRKTGERLKSPLIPRDAPPPGNAQPGGEVPAAGEVPGAPGAEDPVDPAAPGDPAPSQK